MIKLRIVPWIADPHEPKCSHKCPLKKKAEGDWTHTQRRQLSDSRDGDWSDASTGPGTPEPPEAWRNGKDPPLQPPERAWPSTP